MQLQRNQGTSKIISYIESGAMHTTDEMLRTHIMVGLFFQIMPEFNFGVSAWVYRNQTTIIDVGDDALWDGWG